MFCIGTVDINVRITTGKNFPLSVIVSDTIKDVKAKIQEKEGIQPNEQILTFERKKMIDERTLSQYGIQKGSTVVLTIGKQLLIDVYTYTIMLLL